MRRSAVRRRKLAKPVRLYKSPANGSSPFAKSPHGRSGDQDLQGGAAAARRPRNPWSQFALQFVEHGKVATPLSVPAKSNRFAIARLRVFLQLRHYGTRRGILQLFG